MRRCARRRGGKGAGNARRKGDATCLCKDATQDARLAGKSLSWEVEGQEHRMTGMIGTEKIGPGVGARKVEGRAGRKGDEKGSRIEDRGDVED